MRPSSLSLLPRLTPTRQQPVVQKPIPHVWLQSKLEVCTLCTSLSACTQLVHSLESKFTRLWPANKADHLRQGSCTALQLVRVNLRPSPVVPLFMFLGALLSPCLRCAKNSCRGQQSRKQAHQATSCKGAQYRPEGSSCCMHRLAPAVRMLNRLQDCCFVVCWALQAEGVSPLRASITCVGFRACLVCACVGGTATAVCIGF